MNISTVTDYCRRFTTCIMWSVFVLTTQFFSVPVDAKDLYLATNGNDSVSYAANDQANPWLTLDHAVANLAGGDILHIRSGTYAPTVNVVTNVSGTSSAPTTITSFAGEAVVIDLANINQAWLQLDGVDYWEISDLEFINVQMVAEVSLSFVSTGIVFRNNRITANRGGDNVGTIRLMANATNTVIDGNEIIGSGLKADGRSANSGCIHMNRTSNVQVLNNHLSNCSVGFHYKHANSVTNGGNIEFAYNVVDNIDQAFRYNGNNGYVHDNLFIEMGILEVGTNNGVPGGHNTVFDHNTFVSGSLYVSDAGQQGVQGTVVTNNLFLQGANIHISQWVVRPHNTSMDYNLHPTSGNRIGEYNVWYTLSQWISHYGGSANSIEAVPVFAGGANPATPDDYRLTSSSPGFGMAADGSDVGARFDLFGSSGLTLIRPNPPQTLVAN